MKRALLGTLWIGAVAAGVAITLQMGGLLARPAAALAKPMGLAANNPVGFGNLVFIIVLSFAVAWMVLQVTSAPRRALLVLVLALELLGAAWLLHRLEISFSPLASIVSVLLATALASTVTATRGNRQRRATAKAFAGRLAPGAIDRLTEREPLNFFEPSAREVSFVYCEIAHKPDVVDDLPPSARAQLTGEFIDCARKRFLQEGGYLQAADGEGIRVLFGFPNSSPRHAAEAASAALAFRDEFNATAAGGTDSLGKGGLRIGISSGIVIVSMREDAAGHEIVIAGEPFEVARRLARANEIYGSEILLDPRAFSVAGKEIVARPLDFLQSTEAHDRLEIYELLALAKNATPDELARRDRFWTAIVYFRARRWHDARDEFNRAGAGNGATDGPLEWYMRRLEPLCLPTKTQPTPGAEPLVRL
jgi:adenylate cyclase